MMDEVTVLVVDDDASLRRAVRALLERSGEFTVLGDVENGAAATIFAEAAKPDVIVMDAQMPVMGGVGATQRILSSQPHIQIVVMSAVETMEQSAREAGAVDFVVKSRLPSGLLDTLRNIVQSARFRAARAG